MRHAHTTYGVSTAAPVCGVGSSGSVVVPTCTYIRRPTHGSRCGAEGRRRRWINTKIPSPGGPPTSLHQEASQHLRHPHTHRTKGGTVCTRLCCGAWTAARGAVRVSFTPHYQPGAGLHRCSARCTARTAHALPAPHCREGEEGSPPVSRGWRDDSAARSTHTHTHTRTHTPRAQRTHAHTHATRRGHAWWWRRGWTAQLCVTTWSATAR